MTDDLAVPRRQFLKATTGATGAIGFALAGAHSVAAKGIAELSPSTKQRDVIFDSNWRFSLGDIPGAELPEFDDSAWRTIDLPHDWSTEDLSGAPPVKEGWTPPDALWETRSRSGKTEKLFDFIELAQRPQPGQASPGPVGPFDGERSEGGWATGWTVGGTGRYRKSFSAADIGADERVELRFDGVYQEASVWLNGQLLGMNTQGYLGFAFDLTPHLHRDRPNILAVRVRNFGKNSRWYSGSGIYRHVWLTRTGNVRVPLWGVSVSTPEIGPAEAQVHVDIAVSNHAVEARDVEAEVSIFDEKKRRIASVTRNVAVPSGGEERVSVRLLIKRPDLWSSDSPTLYTADVALTADGMINDRITTCFGVRTVALDQARGLLINDMPVKLKGANLHHDNGLLGAVAIDRAERRKVELMKTHGYNAIRCAHNPFSPQFLEACDELGMLVLDELFDSWTKSKVKDDYATRFADDWRRDLAAMIRRDRNHPSVIFWGIGNEIPEAASVEGAQIAADMRALVLSLDGSRPITAALAAMSGANGEPARRNLDVVGYNYEYSAYDADHARDPSKFYMGTEQWARDIHDAWRGVESRPWLLGDFVWTAMDYLGEVGVGSSRLAALPPGGPPPPSPFSVFLWDYPAYQSGCGELDLLGLKKPQGLYRDVLWRRSPLELLVQRPTPPQTYEQVGNWGWHDELASWTWPTGRTAPMTVRTYANADEVALLLNGSEVGRVHLKPADKLTATFQLAYQPGALTAVAYANGREIARRTLETVGPPAKLRLRAERSRIEGSPRDLAYILAEVCDAQDRRVPDASLPLTFSVEGSAKLLASGSANPWGIESLRDGRTRSFHGVAQAILQPTARRGGAILRVSSEGLQPGIQRIVLV